MSYRDYMPDAREGDDERASLARQRAANVRHHRAFLASPDPRDPDHPGTAPRATPLTPQQPKGQK